MNKVRVLIVDDSKLVRVAFKAILEQDPHIEIIGVAEDPFDAREKIKKLNPDVITLDIEMPKMDGLSFLEKIMSLRPMPVVMVSTLTQKGAEATLQALEMGAVDYVAKPINADMFSVSKELIFKVKMAGKAKVRDRNRTTGDINGTRNIAALTIAAGQRFKNKVIAIGSSTGGIEALYEVICRLPENCPPVVVAQHISVGFSERFASRINKSCAVKVEEAQDGKKLIPGLVYIAPGGMHLTLKKKGMDFYCQIAEGEEDSLHKPSVDRLFLSVAENAGKNGIGVILTGMGKDGARGLLSMRNVGAQTFGQDEASCVVYGMPKAAFMAGAVCEEVKLTKMAEKILSACI